MATKKPAKKRVASWVVTDDFWASMERLFGAKPGELLGCSTRVLFAYTDVTAQQNLARALAAAKEAADAANRAKSGFLSLP